MGDRFMKGYAVFFSLIWIGYGLYTVWKGIDGAFRVLGFGIAFSIGLFLTSWFSIWLRKQYFLYDSRVKAAMHKHSRIAKQTVK